MKFRFLTSATVPIWYKTALVAIPIFIFLWSVFLTPFLTALPKDFSYEADISSVDNFYDETIGEYLGEEYSVTTFSYNAERSLSGVLDITHTFNVRTQAGEPIFSVERMYGIDRFTQEHVSGFGDADRYGYLFAPKFLDESKEFTYWHINYDAPAQMEFVAVEKILGLEVLRYHSSYEGEWIDQTENLAYLPGVPEERGVVVEPELTIWVEPVSGHLVKYEDETIAYYYDQETKEKIVPWNRFSNTLTEQSVRTHVASAQDAKTKNLFYVWYVPLLLGLLWAGLIVFGKTVISEFVQKYIHSKVIIPIAGGFLMLSAGVVLVDWALQLGAVFQIFSSGAGMNPLTALTFFIIGLALVFLSQKKMKIVFVLTGGVIFIPILNVLSLTNTIPIDVDLILFRDAIESAGVLSRMSWFTTINFIFLGISGLALQDFPRRIKQFFSFLPFGTLAAALLAIVGYIAKDLALLELIVFSGVGLNTAILFIVVSIVALYIYGFRISRTSGLLFSVFFTTLFISTIMYSYVVSISAQKLDVLFSVETAAVQDTIRDRLSIYANTLAGGVGLFNASNAVSREEWRAYVEAISVQENYPGIQGVGYAVVVEDEQALIEEVRNEGFPEFSVYPESDEELRTSIIYLEPFDFRNQRAFGYDMFSEQNRRLAMQRARDSGLPKISDKITLLQETESDVQAGFLMYLPVYKKGDTPIDSIDSRRAGIEGFVYAPFRMNDFMGGMQNTFDNELAFRMFSGTEADIDQLLYAQNGSAFTGVGGDEGVYSTVFYAAGQPWLIQFKQLPFFGEGVRDTILPPFIAAVGIIVSLLATLILYALLSSRERALAYAERITQNLKLSKDQLLEAKTQTEALLGSIGEGVVAVSMTGEIMFVNDYVENFFGRKGEEFKGQKLFDVVDVADENGKEVPLESWSVYRAIKTKKRVVETRHMVRLDGGEFKPVSITTSPIIVNDKPVGAVAVFRDITQERAIDRAKSEFVSLASHQLRTPLSAINWYAEMLMDGDAGKITKKQSEYLDEIYKGNQRMIDLVNALLNVSRIELGTFSVEPEEMNVNDIVNDVLKEIKTSVDERDIHLSVGTKKLATMVADPQLVRMVVTNLLTNAVKYTPEGGEVTVRTDMVSSGEEVHGKKAKEESVLLSVSDTGYGIPENQKKEIFKKLFRADNVQRRDTKGTGLGLYIAKSIVDLAQGEIWFDSVEDKGTTFYVLLPIHGMEKKEGSKRIS
ncbi:MAG: porin PorA family protein [Patescibacteria group bacterium UBA2103]